MTEYRIRGESLTSIADAIRGKTGKTAALTLDEMATEIAGIQTGGGGGSMFASSAVGRILTVYKGTASSEFTLDINIESSAIGTLE